MPELCTKLSAVITLFMSTSIAQEQNSSSAGCLLGLILNLETEGSIFLRNVSELLSGCTASCPTNSALHINRCENLKLK
jgi:hypothetical protein